MIWAVIGLLLTGFEILVPGLFLVWFGIAGIATAAASFLAPDLGFTTELGVFVFVSGAAIGGILYRHGLRQRAEETGDVILNDRMAALVGERTTLSDPIVNGHGRVFFGDTLWQVTGPDRPAGTTVRVTGHRGMLLMVEPIE